jgi:transcriptional regulator GlxA family with amidase domain
MTTYGILGFDGAEELDFVGPWEVFATSALIHERTGVHGQGQLDGSPDRVVLVAERAEPFTCGKGLRVVPDATFADHPPLDVVLVPGGRGTRVEVDNPRLLDWLRMVAETATWTTSVCTGSFLLHASGVAKGKRLATHFNSEDRLEALGDVMVVRDARFVRDGAVVSSQGVSAGIDMALWLVGQLDSPAHARAVQRWIQYDPAPPYTAEI